MLLYQNIDFRHVDARGRDLKGLIQDGEFLELQGEHGLVPGGQFAHAIVREHVAAALAFAQMLDPDRRHLLEAKLPCGRETTMPRKDLVVGIDQDRRIEPEALDRDGDLVDLFRAMPPRIARVRGKHARAEIGDLKLSH